MLTASEYAKLRGRSKAWVSGRIKAGMPASGSGRSGSEYEIDPAVAIDWEIEQARFDRVEKGGSQRDRLAKEQADKVALANAVERGNHMLRSQVEPVLLSLAAELGASLDAIAGRLASQLAGLSDAAAIRQLLLAEHRGVRGRVADHLRQLAGGLRDVGAGGGGDDASATAKPKRVGRRKPRAAARNARAGAVEK
jgi:phage terminase Nu1 subunit (DNA packaging protein)